MTDRRRTRHLTAVVVAAVLTVAAGSEAAKATEEPGDEPVATATVPAEPETTEPNTSEPNTTEPEDTEPPSSEPGAGTPARAADDDSVDTAAAIIGTIGFIALVAVAAWWMVRRNDGDDAPHPRPDTLDEPLPGHDLI